MLRRLKHPKSCMGNGSSATTRSRRTVIIVDNSVAITGAFKCALSEALLLRDLYKFIFIVPCASAVIPELKKLEFSFYELPMKEVSRSPRALLQYVPTLFQNSLRLKKIIQKENAAVVQMNDFYNLLGVGTRLLGFRGKLLTYVRFLPSSVPGPLRKMWIKAAFRYADAVIAVSDAVLRQLPSNKKAVRVYDAVHFPVKQIQIVEKSEEVMFLYLANYIRGKGQEHAVKAFHNVAQQNKNVRLKFVGGDMGLQKNRAFKNELQQLVKQYALEEKVEFGIFEPNIEKLILESDVVLNFSEAESFSMTCAEAGFYGRPVIATRCGGPEEIVKQNETGLLVGKSNITEMTAAMLRLAKEPVLRQQYGAAAKHWIRKRFNAQEFISSISAIID